jgi:hypothetical protein
MKQMLTPSKIKKSFLPVVALIFFAAILPGCTEDQIEPTRNGGDDQKGASKSHARMTYQGSFGATMVLTSKKS